MNDILDFSVITKANVPAAHFARLCGASRVSAMKWLRGTNPRGLYHEKAKKCLTLVRHAVDTGHLPLRAGINRKDQYRAFAVALRAAAAIKSTTKN